MKKRNVQFVEKLYFNFYFFNRNKNILFLAIRNDKIKELVNKNNKLTFYKFN